MRKRFDGLEAIAGPDALILRTPVETHGKDLTTVAEFTVAKGDRIPFVLTWFASHTDPPRKINPEHALRDTEVFWRDWAKQFESEGKWRDAVVRSLITLKGLTYAPTGGLGCGAYHFVARTNRRRAQLGLSLLLVARCGADFTRVNGRRLSRGSEIVARMASARHRGQSGHKCKRSTASAANAVSLNMRFRGCQGMKTPGRCALVMQLQTNFSSMSMAKCWLRYGRADRAGIKLTEPDWALMVAIMKFLESHWQEPDEGIWEVRGGRQQFTHSKVMAWLAFDRAIKLVENCECAADEHLGRWQEIRDQIHAEVCERGYNPKKKAFHTGLWIRCVGREPPYNATRWISAGH